MNWLHSKGWPLCKIESEKRERKGPLGQKLSWAKTAFTRVLFTQTCCYVPLLGWTWCSLKHSDSSRKTPTRFKLGVSILPYWWVDRGRSRCDPQLILVSHLHRLSQFKVEAHHADAVQPGGEAVPRQQESLLRLVVASGPGGQSDLLSRGDATSVLVVQVLRLFDLLSQLLRALQGHVDGPKRECSGSGRMLLVVCGISWNAFRAQRAFLGSQQLEASSGAEVSHS